MQAPSLILLTNLASTMMMVGVIWFVQIVHYPLFNQIGDETFGEYQIGHMQRTAQVVLLPMFIEAVTAFLLLLQRPPGIDLWQVVLGLALVGVIWLITLFIQVPKHDTLTSGFHADTIQTLVHSNWVRTALWSVRGGLVLWMTARQLV